MEWVTYAVKRGPIRGEFKNDIGLVINVKARPELEEFMKNLSDGRTIEASAYPDNNWINNNDPRLPLTLYNVDRHLGIGSYSMEAIGGPLLLQPQPRPRGVPVAADQANDIERANLSILKLVGISGEDGINLGIGGIYPPELINKLKQNLLASTQQFLRDYLVPISFRLEIVSRPM
jgi:hypothetical protein